MQKKESLKKLVLKLNKLTRICEFCKKIYQSYKDLNLKFCSKICYWKSKKGKPIKHQPHLIQSFLAKGKKPKNYELFRRKSFEKQWKGGVTPEHERIRKSKIYKDWRISVFKRDNFKCQNCGYTGNKLEAHHVKPFALYPELRFDIDNGKTLCKECHDLEETINQYTNPELKHA